MNTQKKGFFGTSIRGKKALSYDKEKLVRTVLILIVLGILLFGIPKMINRTQVTQEGLVSCTETLKGECMKQEECSDPDKAVKNINDCNEEEICCVSKEAYVRSIT